VEFGNIYVFLSEESWASALYADHIGTPKVLYIGGNIYFQTDLYNTE
jgi:hypothetical protein